LKYVSIPATCRLEKQSILSCFGSKNFRCCVFATMRGKNGANADAFASILTMQWRKNMHPKRVRILTQLLKKENKTMKTKKLLSLLLCFVMLFGTITLPANAEDATTTVYVTLSRYGEILTDANGEFLACVPVALCEENPEANQAD
jgi:hypothetical protein